MLEGIRVVTRNWIGRTIMTIVMGVLIVSFAIWGIGDMIRGVSRASVGSVGGVDITADQVRTAYQTELSRLQRQLGRAVTNDQARQAGVDTQVVDRIVNEMALDQKTKKLGLAISDDAIRAAIFDDPTFKNSSGQFDRALFQAALREAGLTEDGFVREQRAIYLRRELAEAVAADVKAPPSLLSAIERYRQEARSVDLATFAPGAAGEISAPSAEQLQAYFDLRKSNYRAPAYRKVVIATLRPSDVAKPDDVPAEEAARAYERDKAAKYTRPEKRRVLQIVYSTEAEAQAALAKAGAGGFDALLADKNLKPSDVDLGLKTQSEIFDKAVAAAAFSQPIGTVSAPIKGDFGWIVLTPTQVEPGAVKPFAEVEPEIRAQLAQQRTVDAVREQREKVEDRRSDGKPLAEAAKDAGLSPRVIEMIDAAGRDDKGRPVADLPNREALVRAIFASDVGADNLALPSGDGGYVWFDVLGLIPARDRTLDEVRDQVATEWKDDEQARRLRAKAEALAAKVKGGEAFDAAAQAEGLEVKRVENIRRDAPAGLAPGVAAQIFNLKVGEIGSAATPEGGRSVFVVRASVVPAFDPKGPIKDVDKQLSGALSNDLIDEYVARLRADANVTIDKAAISRALFGAGDAN
jgi:peptidyl-prolyl cis-trans isomerase D